MLRVQAKSVAMREGLMNQKKMRAIWLLNAGFVMGLDQLTKYLSTRYLMLNDQISIFPGLDLTLRHNTGAAFSFLANASGWQRWFFIGLALLMSTIIYVWLGRLYSCERYVTRAKQEGFALSLILGGAIGNVIDRLMHGYVIDFILLYYEKWQWPAFNLADSAICVGAILLFPVLFKKQSL